MIEQISIKKLQISSDLADIFAVNLLFWATNNQMKEIREFQINNIPDSDARWVPLRSTHPTFRVFYFLGNP